MMIDKNKGKHGDGSMLHLLHSRFQCKWYVNGTSLLATSSSFINLLIELNLLALIELIIINNSLTNLLIEPTNNLYLNL